MPRRDPYSYFATSPQAGETPTTWSVGDATTYTGLCLSNPAASGYDLVLTEVGFVLNAAPAARSAVGLLSGFSAAGVVTHTTALTVQTAKIGDTENAVGLADSACTIVGTPRWLKFLQAIYVATPAETLVDFRPVVEKLDPHAREYIIPPGGYICIGAHTVIIGWAWIRWYETAIERP